jgi:hypothetical protein
LGCSAPARYRDHQTNSKEQAKKGYFVHFFLPSHIPTKDKQAVFFENVPHNALAKSLLVPS